MHTSFCTIGFQKNKWGRDRAVEVSLPEILPVLRSAGFDGVEIWAEHFTTLDEIGRRKVVEQLRQLGLRVAMLSPYFDFTSSDESAQMSLHQAREVLSHARQLGSGGIRVFTGKTGSHEATPAQWQRTVDCLRQLADESAADNLFWALETHPRNLMDTIDSTLKLMADIDRPNVRLIFQPSTFGADYLAATDALGHLAVHVHATNSKAKDRCLLGQGDMDWPQIISRLDRSGFDGFVSVEWMGDDAPAVARTEGQYLRKIIG